MPPSAVRSSNYVSSCGDLGERSSGRSRPLAVVTGYAKSSDTRAAVSDVVTDIGMTVPRPAFLLMFLGGKLIPEQALDEAHAAFPNTPILGVAGAGVVASQGFGYSGCEVGIMAWSRAETAPRLVFTDRLAESDYAGGAELGKASKRLDPSSSVVMLFYSSVRSYTPRALHSAGRLIEGFYDGWGDRPPELIGGGALTDLNLSDAWLLAGGEVHRHAAAALVFPRTVKATTQILRACRVASAFMEITAIDGDVVSEIDGQPALTVIEDLAGRLVDDEGHPLQISILGKNLGDRFEFGSISDFVNRLIFTADRKNKTVTLFEPDFRVGDIVQLMKHDPSLMLEEVREGAEASRALPRGRPLLRLYIDCAGRASVMSGTTQEEADVLRRALKDDSIPLMGFYSGVEIAPVEGRSRSLDWTGVLVTLVEDT